MTSLKGYNELNIKVQSLSVEDRKEVVNILHADSDPNIDVERLKKFGYTIMSVKDLSIKLTNQIEYAQKGERGEFRTIKNFILTLWFMCSSKEKKEEIKAYLSSGSDNNTTYNNFVGYLGSERFDKNCAYLKTLIK